MKTDPPPVGLIRGIVALLVLFLGIGAAALLIMTRKTPDTVPPAEPVLAVELRTVQPTETTVEVTSTGVASPVRTVQLSAEVSGQIVEMPRILKPGDQVEKGALLLRIDPEDYELRLREAQASVTALEASRSMIETGEKADRRQLKASKRSLELAQSEFERLRDLRAQGQSVSQSAVDAAERAVQQAESQVIQLEQSLDMAPQRQSETDSQLAAARARVAQAARNLERCSFRAPFTGRVVSVPVEEGEWVQPGMPLMEIADDSALEIPVAVSASDLQQWIPFEERIQGTSGWFPPISPVAVAVEWTASNRAHIWTGRLDRVVSFDADTRTATLAIRVEGEDLESTDSGFPLTAGMFCSVRIPGKTLSGVFVLPNGAVTFDNQVYVSDHGRLATVDVEVLDRSGTDIIVGGGLTEGDQIILTRLVAPLEGAKLKQAEN